MPTTIKSASPDFTTLSLDLAAARAIARGAGDLTVTIREEIVSVLKKNRGHQLKAVFAGLDQMKKLGHVTEGECLALKKLCEQAFNFDRKKTAAAVALSELSAIHRQVLIDSNASPAALAITSAVNAVARSTGVAQSSGATAPVATAIVITPGNAATGAAIGGVLGGVIGGIIGGGIGAGIGAAIGAAAGAAIGACNAD